MLCYILMGFFAAVGVLTLLWLCSGVFLSRSYRQKVAIFCPKGREIAFLRRYRWLRELGLVRCRIILLDSALPESVQTELTQHFPGVSFLTLEQWRSET